MNNCYTIEPRGARTGIPITATARGPIIQVGEDGRGRELVRVALPEGSKHDEHRVQSIPTSTPDQFVVLIRDHSGFRGGWAAEFDGDVTIIAEGASAQGAAGRMGGGPEYLLRASPGASVTIRRRGRLYGKPAVLRVAITADGVSTVDVAAEEAATEAASRF